jgi:hypothetical protein
MLMFDRNLPEAELQLLVQGVRHEVVSEEGKEKVGEDDEDLRLLRAVRQRTRTISNYGNIGFVGICNHSTLNDNAQRCKSTCERNLRIPSLHLRKSIQPGPSRCVLSVTCVISFVFWAWRKLGSRDEHVPSLQEFLEELFPENIRRSADGMQYKCTASARQYLRMWTDPMSPDVNRQARWSGLTSA